MNIQELINNSIKKEQDERKKKQAHWYPSQFGKCLRGVYLMRKEGIDPEFDDRTLRVFKCGKVFEDWVVSEVIKNLPKDKYETQGRVELPEYDYAGYYDLRIEDVIYELKTVHSKKFWYMTKSGEPDEHYLMQLMFYLIVTGKPEGRLLYVSKDDLAMQEYILYATDEKIKSKVLKEMKTLSDAWKTNTPPEAEPSIVDGKINWKAKYCSVHDKCTGNPNWLSEAEELIK